MPDSLLGYQDPAVSTAKLRGKVVGTSAGLDVVAEAVQLEPGETPRHGRKVAPTGPAEALAGSATPVRGTGVTLRSLLTNSEPIFVGAAGVTAATGYPLYIGDSVTVAVDDPAKVFVVALVGGQEVAWIGAA